MFEKGQRVVVREPNGKEDHVLIEEVIVSNDGQQLKVKDVTSGATRMVNPVEQTIVESLED